jgi:flagellar biogenesis protein FliO
MGTAAVGRYRLLPNLSAQEATVLWARLCRGLRQWAKARSVTKRIRLEETLSLGERRSVVLLEVDGARLLIGITANSIQVLQQCSPAFDGKEVSLQVRGTVR